MKIKRVKSKTGKIYTYDASKYKYTHKSTRGLTLVGKGGRIDKKNIQKYMDSIDASSTYSAVEKRYLKKRLEAAVNERHKAGEKLTTTGFIGLLQKKSSIARMFSNAGYSTADVAAQYGVSEAELLDDARWSGNVFTSRAGRSLTFKFTYTGDILA